MIRHSIEETEAFYKELKLLIDKEPDKSGLCRFNEGVGCSVMRCYECGWNPVIAQGRKARIKYLLEAGGYGEEN